MAGDFTPQRVVSLQPSATVTLHALGLLDRVVACTKYCVDVCPHAASGRLIIADSWTAQSEQIMAAHPDLVIASVPYQEAAIAEILKSGARFLGLAPKSLDDVYGDIVAIARIMDAVPPGLAVIHTMQFQLQAVAEKTKRDGDRPRVSCEEWGKPIIRSQKWVAELVEAAGGEFVGDPGKQATAEQIAAENPDIIITAWCGAGDRVPLEKIIRDRGWQDLKAARDGRVYCIRDELLNTPGPTLTGGLYALASAIHPGLFPRIMGVRRIDTTATAAQARVI